MTDQSTGPSDERLLTLAEAAALTGLSVEALRQRAKRRRLRTVKGNDGLVRVRLSLKEIDRLKTGQPVGQPSGDLSVESSRTNEVSSDVTLAGVLGAQVADLLRRLDQAGDRLSAVEAEHRSERATWQAERDRLLALVELLAQAREAAGQAPTPGSRPQVAGEVGPARSEDGGVGGPDATQAVPEQASVSQVGLGDRIAEDGRGATAAPEATTGPTLRGLLTRLLRRTR